MVNGVADQLVWVGAAPRVQPLVGAGDEAHPRSDVLRAGKERSAQEPSARRPTVLEHANPNPNSNLVEAAVGAGPVRVFAHEANAAGNEDLLGLLRVRHAH